MSNTGTPSSGIHIDISAIQDLVRNVHLNVSQELIITTDDKVRLCLLKHLGKMGKRKGWIAPFGILAPIVLTLVTSTFKDLGLSADTWQALFIIAAIGSFAFLIYSIIGCLRAPTMEDVVAELKRESKSLNT